MELSWKEGYDEACRIAGDLLVKNAILEQQCALYQKALNPQPSTEDKPPSDAG